MAKKKEKGTKILPIVKEFHEKFSDTEFRETAITF